jgi:hypothetical protein
MPRGAQGNPPVVGPLFSICRTGVLRTIRFIRARASGVFTRYPCADFNANPRPANRSPQANALKVVLHFRASPTPCPPTTFHTPERMNHRQGYPRGVSAPKTFWRDRQLNPRNVHSRGYVSPAGFLNLLGSHPGLRRRAVCFTRPPFMGFRLPGACASGAVHLSMNPLPSCRYFSALFPSEEWKTTGSSAFRAFFPVRVGMPLVHGRSPELKCIRAPA